MARGDVEILIKATDKASKQLDRIEKEMKQLGTQADKTGKQVKKSSSAWEGLQKNWMKIAAGGAAVAAAFYAVKKAYDFGKEGAIIKQTAESFDTLLAKVGAAPDLLNDLREASRGTVDDMTIMKGTALVLAGVSGDLAKSIAKATPELMNIAKAANKLNPALGDTAFMYESIATGVKRAQPLILDNLGLTIKVGAANEEMARSLGKSVEELTAEEKSMAILNDTLRAGKVLLAQVGGTTKSAGDEFMQFEVNMKNLSDSLKSGASPAIRGVVKDLNDLIEASLEQRDVVEQLITLNYLMGASDEEVRAYMLKVKLGTLDLAEAQEFATETLARYMAGTENADTAMAQSARHLQDLKYAYVSLTESTDNLAGGLEYEGQGLWDVNQKLLENKKLTNAAAKAADGLLKILDRKVASPIASFIEDMKWMAAGGDKINEMFKEIKEKVDLGLLSPEEGIEASKILGFTAVDLAVELDQTDLDEGAQQIADMFGIPTAEAKEMILGTEGPGGAMDALEAKQWRFDIDVYFKYHNAPPGFKTGYIPEEVTIVDRNIPVGAASGLSNFMVPPGYPNDSFPINVTSGETVNVSPAGKPSSGGVTNNFFKIFPSPGMDEVALAGLVAQRIERSKMTSMRSGALYSGAH